MKKTILFLPFSGFNENFFDKSISNNEFRNSNPFNSILTKSHRKKFDIYVNNFDFDYNHLHSCFVFRNLNKKEKKFVSKARFKCLYIFEPEVVDPSIYKMAKTDLFDKIYTFDDKLVDNIKYFKFYYPNLDYNVISNIKIAKKRQKRVVQISGNKCSVIDGELYTLRRKIIDFYENHESDFDFFGRGFDFKRNNCFGQKKIISLYNKFLNKFLIKPRKLDFKNYKGIANKKIFTLSKYKFAFVIENSCAQEGYITEKIFDTFYANTVPIYYGAGNIEKYIPKACFIDFRDFDTLSDLDNYLCNISCAEYKRYQDEINAFLKSSKYSLFTNAFFIDNFMQDISDCD